MTPPTPYRARPPRRRDQRRYRPGAAPTRPAGRTGRTDAKPDAALRASPRGTLRIIPLGGLEEIGRNCTVYEYEDDIIIVDLGIQFPEEDMPGIDFIIPNTAYLRGK